MLCSHCHRQRIFAIGLCQRCHTRKRDRGTLPAAPSDASLCKAEACKRPVHANGFCHPCYSTRLRSLRVCWKNLRKRYPGQFPEAWMKFPNFLADVGDKPVPRASIRRRDEALPFSRDNVIWLPAVPSPLPGNPSAGQKSTYNRERHLLRKYAITSVEYDRLLKAQGGVCAICKLPPEIAHKGNTRSCLLGVDHCHTTGRVRSLLCVRCNNMIGSAKESPDLLRAAIAYLEHHAEPAAEEAA